jgi:hypothetical protein
MSKIFWDLSDEEILQGMAIYNNKELREHKPPLSMQMFVYDSTLRRMAEMLVDCKFDRTLMKLTYADEIAESDNKNTPWFAPAGLNRGIINP